MHLVVTPSRHFDDNSTATEHSEAHPLDFISPVAHHLLPCLGFTHQLQFLLGSKGLRCRQLSLQVHIRGPQLVAEAGCDGQLDTHP